MTLPPSSNSPIYDRFHAWSRDFSARNDAHEISGEYYDIDQNVYTTSDIKPSLGGKVEVNLTYPEVQDRFSWVAEITIDDVRDDSYIHLLLQTDGEIVETYGKQVIEVSDTQAEKYLRRVQE